MQVNISMVAVGLDASSPARLVETGQHVVTEGCVGLRREDVRLAELPTLVLGRA